MDNFSQNHSCIKSNKIRNAMAAIACVLFVLLYVNRGAIFQKGNPVPYLIAASKIAEENPYVEVDENIVISKLGECSNLFEDFEKQTNLKFMEQAGSGYIFTDGTSNYTISSEIYWGRYTVWTLPITE